MEKKLLHYLNESPTVFFILKKVEKSWELEYVTSNVIKLYGYSAEDFLSKRVKHEDFIYNSDLHSFRDEQRQVAKVIKDEYIYKPYRLVNNGNIIWVNHIIKKIHDEQGKLSHYYGYLTDITEMQKVKQDLERHLSIINDNVLISITDKKGIILDVSDAYCRLTKYNKNELIGKNHNLFRHPKTKDEFFIELWNTILHGRIWKGEHLNIDKYGNEFWVENSITPNFNDNGEIVGFTSVYNDITDKKRIAELSITDYLTKLYNRRHFSHIFETELKRAKRDNYNFVLMIVDIDFFKQYNDTYGHDAGDEVIKAVAMTLKNRLKRSKDFVFRLGGEEFGIITSNIDLVGINKLTKQLLEGIKELKIEHKSSTISEVVTISIGVKNVLEDENLEESLIYKLADSALYLAKQNGRNQVIIT